MVSKFTVFFSADGEHWTAVDNEGTFDSHCESMADDSNYKEVMFTSPVSTRYVKIQVLSWSHHISMRAALLVDNDNEYEYKMNKGKKNWSDARKACQNWNGELASANTSDKRDEVKKVLNGKRAWLGGHDKSQEGSWKWTDGAEWDFNAWHNKQPDNHRANENCLEENWKGEWNDMRCNYESNYICQRVKGLKKAQTKFADFHVYNPEENMRTYSTIWGGNAIGTGHGRSMLNSAQGWSAQHNNAD